LFQNSSSSSSSLLQSQHMSSLAQPPTSSNCCEDWLEHIARQSDASFVHEEVLRAKLQQPACTLGKEAP
jgi:hypothetical protein